MKDHFMGQTLIHKHLKKRCFRE